MVDSKYTKCVDVDFERFPSCLRDNNDDISQMTFVGKFGTYYNCYLAAETKFNEADDSECFVFGIVFIDRYEMGDTLEVRYKCFIKNYDEPDVQSEEVKEIITPQWEEHENYKYTENNYDMEEILDEKNGFLKNEKLTVRVEISVDTIIASNGIRQWGFPRFETNTKQLSAIRLNLYDSIKIYANRQIMEFHASCLSRSERSYCEDDIDRFLQIMHGVQPIFDYNLNTALSSAIYFASYYQIHNVLRICEQGIISAYRLGDRSGSWYDALNYNFRSFLKLLLEKIKSPNELKDLLEKEKWKGSSVQVKKHLVAKFFSFV